MGVGTGPPGVWERYHARILCAEYSARMLYAEYLGHSHWSLHSTSTPMHSRSHQVSQVLSLSPTHSPLIGDAVRHYLDGYQVQLE
jgi:hypothetical protein